MKLNNLLRSLLLCALSAALLTSGTPLLGEYKFREFRDEQDRFERYTDDAQKSATEQEWQDILDSGREEMRAAWERVADEEAVRYIREGGDESDVRSALEEAKAGWERDFEAGEADAKGAWYLQRENLAGPAVDLRGLKERVAGANKDQNITDINMWDSYVKSALDSVNSGWNAELTGLLTGARAKGAGLTGTEREGFEKELESFEKALESGFELERDSVLILARNSFITERYTDTGSLRRKSEAGSAAAITERVIQGVQGEVKSEEDKILNRSFSGEGSESINFSGMGDDWQDDLKKLIETGMSKWNAAREKLYNEMVNWKNTANEAFENIEAKWKLGLEKLEKARSEWEIKLSGEIYDSLDKWEKEEDTLSQNIVDARRDFNDYMENLSGQWADHSQGLIDMAVNGSKVYTDALENIKWLTGIIDKYRGQPAFTDNSAGLAGVLETECSLSVKVNTKLDELIEQNRQNINDPLMGGWTGQAIELYTQLKNGSKKYDIKAQLIGIDESNPGRYIERYSISVTVMSPQLNIGGTPFSYPITMLSFNWDNVVTENSDPRKKSAYYIYKTELARWNNIAANFRGIAADAESYMHERDMLGQNGPGYLDQAAGSDGDPYLMTGAEFNYETAKRDRDFWESRLAIAKAVLDYAFPAGGKRESAEETERNKNEAYNRMYEAKTAYLSALNETDKIVADLKSIQQAEKPSSPYNEQNPSNEWAAYLTSIEYLSEKYRAAGENLKEAEKSLEVARTALILEENGKDVTYIRKEIGEIQDNILSTDKEIRDRRTEYYNTLKEGERVSITSGYAAVYQKTVKERESANYAFSTLKGIISGEESDANLVSWGSRIAEEPAAKAVWGDSSAVKSVELLSLVKSFNESAGAEKDRARLALSSYIRNLYSSIGAGFAKSDMALGFLQDKNFNPGEYPAAGVNILKGVNREYAGYSLDALNVIRDAMDRTGGSGDFNGIASYLGNLCSDPKYIYGGDNSVFMANYTALKIFEERYRGLTPETWSSYSSGLDRDIEVLGAVADLYSGTHYDEFKTQITGYENEAAAGSPVAVALLREYFNPGSSIAGYSYIEEFMRKGRDSRELENYASAFVNENYNVFRSIQDELNSRDYLSGMLGYINSELPLGAVGEDVTLTLDNLKTLTPLQLSRAAEGAERYINSIIDSGIPVPSYLIELSDRLVTLKSGLDDSLLISEFMSGRITGTVDEICNSARAAAEISGGAASFIESALNFYKSGGYGAGETANQILLTWNNLPESSKAFIRNNDNTEIKSLSGYMDSLASSLENFNIATYADNYIASGGGMKPSDYMAALGLSGKAAEELGKIIEPAYERGRFESELAAGSTGSIEEYISSNLTGEAAAELRRYALVKNFLSFRDSAGYSGADSAFTEYAAYRKFEDYLKSFMNTNTKSGSETDNEYLGRVMAGWAGGGGYGYRDFAADFMSKEITSFAYLPDDVKVFAGSELYYNEVFKKGKVLDESALEDFLEERFGGDSITGSIVDEVFVYAEKLNTVAAYYGQDGYLSRLSGAKRDFIGRYLSSGEAALLPGFEYGIYGNRVLSGALVRAEGGDTETALNEFISSSEKNLPGLMLASKMDADRERSAESLRAFYSSGAGGDNWRDYILPGVSGNNTVVYTPFSVESPWYDGFDTVTGMRNSLIYSEGKLEKDGRKFSQNRVISDANALYDLFDALFRGAGKSTGAENRGIADFIAEVENSNVYKKGELYTPGNDGTFGFEKGLSDIASGYLALSSDYLSKSENLASMIAGMENSLKQSDGILKSKKGSYDILAGGDKEKLLMDFGAARDAHELAKAEFEKLGKDLNAAQERFNSRNNDYITHLSGISSLYKTYKDYEFAYEEAYAKWEYGNTPYLKGEVKNDSGVSTGELPGNGGTNVDLSGIPVPDARENYERVKAKYDEALKVFTDAENAKNSQEDAAGLNADTEYCNIKNELTDNSEAFARSAQVDSEIKEKLAEYKLKYEDAQKNFDAAKDGLIFFSQGIQLAEGDKDKISELEKARDLIMSHVKSPGDVNKLMESLDLYSCKVQVNSGKYVPEPYVKPAPTYDNEGRLIGDDFAYAIWLRYSTYYACTCVRDAAVQFDALSEQMKSDVGLLCSAFGNTDSIKIIMDNYHVWLFSDKKHHYYADGIKKGRHRHPEDKYERAMWRARDAMEYPVETLGSTLNAFVDAKTVFVSAEKKYRDVSSVKYIADIKRYVGPDSVFKLTDEDLEKIYDSTILGYTPQAGSIRIDYLRKEEQRKDLDGDAVQARVVNGKVEVVLKDGTGTDRYDINDAGVRLKTGDTVVTEFKEGALYDFYDMNYNIADVTGVIKGSLKALKDESYANLMLYVNRSAADGKHDYTVMLRDLEATYHALQERAVNFNTANEYRQRMYDGYGEITRQYVNNGSGTSIEGLVLSELKKQSGLFQEQQWKHQQDKFNERKDRWMETTGYIWARGDREWGVKTADYINQWKKWRYEARKEMAEGLEWWEKTDAGMKGDMARWSGETSKASSKAAAEKMYEDLARKIERYETAIKSRGGTVFDIDTDKIFRDTMRNLPVDTIGILSQSMAATDTTAGLAQMLNLGLSNSLFKYNDTQMAEYEAALGIVQNMRVIDIFNGIIENFNKQLEEANKSAYRGIKINIANMDPYLYAPFKRNETEKQWSIKVCVESNLTGNKYKTRKFADYSYMLNSTVFLQPIKGIGGKIDFNDSNTYIMLDKDELDVYVGLEQDALSNRIEEVFKSPNAEGNDGGLFATHQQEEYTKIGEKFGKYYGEWVAGEALKDGAFYSKPMFPNGPNLITTAAIVGGLAGGPWAAFAVSMFTTGMQVADGSMEWKQAAFNVGVSAATAAIGVGASELGGMVGGAANATTQAGAQVAGETAAKSMTQIVVENVTRGVAQTLLSGVTYDGKGFGWDGERMGSWKTWAGAGVTAAAGSYAAGYNLGGLSSSLLTGAGSMLSNGITTGDWGDSFKTGLTTTSGNYLGGLIGGGISGEGGLDMSNEYTKSLINNYTTYGMRKLFGSDEEFDMTTISNVDVIDLVVNDMYKTYNQEKQKEQQEEEERIRNEEAKQRRDELIEKYGRSEGDKIFVKEQKQQAEAEANVRIEAEKQRRADRARDPFAPVDDAISGIFVSLGRGLGQTMKDISKTIENGAKSAVEGVMAAGKLAAAGVSWVVDEAVALGESAKDAISGWMSDDEKDSVKANAIEYGSEKYNEILNKYIDDVIKYGTPDEKVIYTRYRENITGVDENFVFLGNKTTGEEEGRIIQGITWRDQRDNNPLENVGIDGISGSKMCQLSALANLFEGSGIEIPGEGQPENLLLKMFVNDLGKNPSDAYNDQIGTYENLTRELTGNKSDIIIDVSWKGYKADDNDTKEIIDSGLPVATGSNTTGKGHVLTVIGYDKTGWIVNDSYGNRNLNYNQNRYDSYGYDGHNGSAVHYNYGSYNMFKNWRGYMRYGKNN